MTHPSSHPVGGADERPAGSAFPVLVINSGSSSLKFALIDPVSGVVTLQGLGDRLDTPEAILILKENGSAETIAIPNGGHEEALRELLPHLRGRGISAVGHRVVNGGERFTESILLDDGSQEAIASCSDIAPVHAIPNATGIRVARTMFPDLPQAAVFDTAFHQTIPPHAHMYGLPAEFYEKHRIRKYGFHGTSHRFVSTEAARLLGKPVEELQLITAHLGNGSSVCAVRAGKSADTSMGFTPLEGLVMGTRCGDLDPNILLFLHEKTGMTLREITDILNKRSGLLGLSGISHDMRTLLEQKGRGHAGATLAVEVFCYRLARHILASAAALDRLDALVFTGGIGENAAPVREITAGHLKMPGILLDPGLNAENGRNSGGLISAPGSRIPVLVVATNEELVIARETARLVSEQTPSHAP
jgi:acetate kinase